MLLDQTMLIKDYIHSKQLGLLAGTLISVLLISIVYASWQWRTDWQLAHHAIVLPTIRTKTDKTPTLLAALDEAHLFGKSITKSELPLSSLQLRLTGIVMSDKTSSKVYISHADEPSKIYKIGDKLPSGVSVYAITQEAVVLENGGRLEKLPLQREPLQFKPKTSRLEEVS